MRFSFKFFKTIFCQHQLFSVAIRISLRHIMAYYGGGMSLLVSPTAKLIFARGCSRTFSARKFICWLTLLELGKEVRKTGILTGHFHEVNLLKLPESISFFNSCLTLVIPVMFKQQKPYFAQPESEKMKDCGRYKKLSSRNGQLHAWGILHADISGGGSAAPSWDVVCLLFTLREHNNETRGIWEGWWREKEGRLSPAPRIFRVLFLNSRFPHYLGAWNRLRNCGRLLWVEITGFTWQQSLTKSTPKNCSLLLKIPLEECLVNKVLKSEDKIKVIFWS